MKIKSIHLRDFKRFTDLTVTDIPETAKLVVLVGSNGSGKTSLFEAFNFWIWRAKKGSISFSEKYHWKVSSQEKNRDFGNLYSRILIDIYNDTLDIKRYNQNHHEWKKAFYIRSAYRHESNFASDYINRVKDILSDARAPQRLIETEQRVSDNYQRLTWKIMNEVLSPSNRQQKLGELQEQLIGNIRSAMQNVFIDLNLQSLGKPDDDGTFLFHKGTSYGFLYENLSGGEKAAFDLLLDFIMKTAEFDDTVFCIDEPELHMHTKLQGKLLNELYTQLPENCQLWIATHSIGMMHRAMELYQQNPEQVVFLDFDGHNFDEPVIMKPTQVNRQFWKKVFHVAMDDLADLVAPSAIVFCEGKPDYEDGATFDAEIYRAIFAATHPQTEFVPLNGSNEVEKNSLLIEGVLNHMFSSIKMWRLIDRDDRNETEIEEARAKGTKILGRRDIENYLWDDEILTCLCKVEGKSEILPDILAEKQRLLSALPSHGKPKNDVKAISGKLYNFVKKQLGFVQRGNNAQSFAKETLAPLITPDTKTYRELEQDIFDN